MTDGTRPDWLRIFPDADHRWSLGLRRGDAAAFFRPGQRASDVLAERARWLAGDCAMYAALAHEAEPALADTVALARAQGAEIDEALSPSEQMLSLGRVWEPDFVWMHADGEGPHRVTGGVVCFPSSWALRDKLGRTMSETHSPVPGVNAALDRPIEAFFHKLEPGVTWVRENASYSRTNELNHHPDLRRRPLDATVTIDEVWVRVEHQLLLKLPTSRSILFGIRVDVHPLREIIETPLAAARLTRLLGSMSPAVAEYKGLTTARATILAFLGAPLVSE